MKSDGLFSVRGLLSSPTSSTVSVYFPTQVIKLCLFTEPSRSVARICSINQVIVQYKLRLIVLGQTRYKFLSHISKVVSFKYDHNLQHIVNSSRERVSPQVNP